MNNDVHLFDTRWRDMSAVLAQYSSKLWVDERTSWLAAQSTCWLHTCLSHDHICSVMTQQCQNMEMFYYRHHNTTNQWSKKFDIRPHCRRTRMIQSYSPGSANVHPIWCIPIGIHTLPVLPPAELLWVYQPPVMSGRVLGRHLFALKIAHSHMVISTKSNTWFFGPTPVHIKNDILISSAAGLMVMTHRHTDRQTTLLHL